MAWKDEHGLRKRINTIPHILCGPLLRRVEPDSVSVFVALKQPRSVTLTVYEGDTAQPSKHKFESDAAETVRLGKYLHVALVTAKLRPPLEDLKPGTIYGYDLAFKRIGPRDPNDMSDPPTPDPSTLSDHDLLSAQMRFPLGYGQDRLPTFSLPPEDLNDLRIVHGSCRKPHGEGLDAFEALDTIIESTVKEPNKRPHQLFLTGDQIYADDVADALLLALTEAGDTLLGWEEALPGVSGKRPKDLKPGRRSQTMKQAAGFTSSADKSHLIGVGEFFAMYLFVWSVELWPLILPGFEDVYPGEDKDTKRFARFAKEERRLRRFRDALPKVRRALANVPTYMIFDDHEVTDDWYLNLEWCKGVLSKPLGRRVIQNGLLAYALFQAWGNTPERFTHEGLPTPGRSLLDDAEAWSLSAGADDSVRGRINDLVGVPEDFLNEIRTSKRLTHRPGSLEWHYTVTGPSHEVLVLDIRTWRAFPGASIDYPALLSDEGFQMQILGQPRSDRDVTIVVSGTPVVGVPFIEAHQEKAKTQAERLSKDTESWSLQSRAFESLFATLARRATQIGQKRMGRILFFSGDVHYGFAARFQYWGERPFGDPQPMETELVVAQLTASSLRNFTSIEETERRTEATQQLHYIGFSPLGDVLPVLRNFGWNNPGGGKKIIGKYPGMKGEIDVDIRWVVVGDPAVTRRSSMEVGPAFEKDRLELNQPPHWRYRIDHLLAEHEVRKEAPFDPIDVTSPPPANRLKALQEYLKMAKNHEDYVTKWGDGKEIVGLNNIGEVTFNWGSGDDKSVTQLLWWQLKKKQGGAPDRFLEPFPLTKCVVSLGFNDPDYPKPTAPVQP